MDHADSAYQARRLPRSKGPAAVQLAESMALLAGLAPNTPAAVHWYAIAPPALMLGPAQSPDVINAAACTEAGVTVQRRKSGGGVVLADENLLNLDLAIPRQHPLFTVDVTQSYAWIGEVWGAALQNLGLAARLISIAEARADAQTLDAPLKHICFAGLSPYEVAVGQRKVVGLAQVRRKAGALIQCGVHLQWEPKRTAALIAAPASDRSALADQLAERVAGLSDLLDQPVDATEVAVSVEAALGQLIGLTLIDAEWNAAEQAARAAALEH